MIERLAELGFSSQEARVYLALLQHPSATGYEVAKIAGLQRANVYQVLSGLTDRGVVDRVSDGTPGRFVAHPPAAVLGRIKRQTAERADSLIADLAAVAAPREQAGFFSLRDRESVIDRAASLVAEARTRVAVCAWADDLEWLAPGLRAAAQSGRQVVINVFGETEIDGADVYRHEAPSRTVGGQLLMLAVDFDTALVASLDEPVGAVVTEHPALVGLVEKVIRDEAYLAAIYQRFGDQLEAEFGTHLFRLRTRLLPPDRAEELFSIVGFGADDTVSEILSQEEEQG
ncbi:TrmB family transcriptional regulator [Microlunatus parietis]|uniref:Sugar-specific transcriptional regulator TrmB n=1 Tax=Microlunatus parietis TaxID=682979 RepID=A0A7Y9LAA2_9ACTN|nr:TrmB family transcriptional regulator [Microlunatus parietis]NYE70442.1 sugar-specific transcriptional regulator TrmB [Microlunatus parietis]